MEENLMGGNVDVCEKVDEDYPTSKAADRDVGLPSGVLRQERSNGVLPCNKKEGLERQTEGKGAEEVV